MSLDTYSNLKTELAAWLDDSSLSSYLDTFIDLCEAEINRRLRVPEMEKRATATVSTTTRFLALPTDFTEMRKLRLNSDPLWEFEQLTPHQIGIYYLSGSGKAKYFCVNGDELEFNRIFDSAYTAEMAYWKKLSALSGSNTTNTILTNYPELYLYGSLKSASAFVKDDERINLWAGLFDKHLSDANRAARNNIYGPAGLVQRVA